MKNQIRKQLINIEEIKKDKINGKKKWGLDLYKFIVPYLQENHTYEKIAIILKEKYDFEISVQSLKNFICYYKKSKVDITKSVEKSKTNQISESLKKGEDKKVEIVLNEDLDPDEIMRKMLIESSESSEFEEFRAKVKKQIRW